MLLLIIAILGLLAPNGIYVYWLTTEFTSVADVLNSELAVGFFIEMIAASLLIGYWFAVNPLGKVRWYWFVLMSLLGGIGFAIPLYIWLNRRPRSRRRITKSAAPSPVRNRPADVRRSVSASLRMQKPVPE